MLRILFITLSISTSLAQDERFFRELFMKSSVEVDKQLSPLTEKYKWAAEGRKYRYDLNGDGNYEGIKIHKRDGRDLLAIYGQRGDLLAATALRPQGNNARIYKVVFHKMSEDVRVLLIYYYEGVNQYTEMLSTGRLHLATIYKGDLGNITFTEGPRYWEEFQSFKGHYHQRRYKVIVADIDKDNTKEILVRYGHSSTLLKLTRENTWKEI